MPAVVLVKPTPPIRIALTVPDCMSKVVDEVSFPVVPIIEPDINFTAFTVSDLMFMSKVPPFTTRLEVLASLLLADNANVPALTVVSPVCLLLPDKVNVALLILLLWELRK